VRELDFLQTGVMDAFNGWLAIFNDVLELTAAVPPAFSVVVESVERANWRLLNEVLGITAGKAYDAAKHQLESSNETLYVLFLLASWAAFESFVEEIPGALIRIDPALISTPAFEKARNRADRENLTGSERLERIIDIVVPNQKGPLTAQGGGKYEDQLRLVGLDGEVPVDLALALMEAQQVRNIWAHNGGRADKKLLDHCTGIGVALGEKVAMTGTRLSKYTLAQNTYTTIIVNRARKLCGLQPLECHDSPSNVFKPAFDKLFPNTVSTHALVRKLEAECADDAARGS
jgi:hypothetical protein